MSPGRLLRRLAWELRLLPLAPRRPVPLLYHGVSDYPETIDMRLDAFTRQLEFIADRYTVVPWQDDPPPRGRGERVQVVLTFDDGLGTNAEVVAPLLRRLGLPAMFFVCARHSAPGKYLWFRHIDLIEKHYPGQELTFRENRWPMTSKIERRRAIAALGDILIDLEPHPGAMYEAIEGELPRLEDFAPEVVLREGRGIAESELKTLAANSLFTIAAHTLDHPYLTRCAPAEAARQLEGSRRWVEGVTGRPCPYVAYPSGDYDATTIRLARAAGFSRAFAVRPRVGADREMEVARFGIHRESVDDLAIKVRWGAAMRRAGRKVN